MSQGLLQGKVVLITGAGNGIGRAHALACAQAGAAIVVNDLGGARDGSGTDSRAAAQVVAEIEALGGKAVASFDSVATAAGAAAMVKLAVDTFGRLDVVVNNAGILRDTTFRKMTEDQWRIVQEVHLNGTFHVCQAALPALMSQGGAIINTTSYSGLIGNFGQSNYAAAKAGIYGFTRVLSMELKKAGITVNCIAPIAKTRMTEDIAMVEAEWTPEQISPVVVYLASDLSKEVTGRVFGIQGQRIHGYEVKMSDGVEKPGAALWTAEEIAQKLDAIFAFEAPAAPAAAPAAAKVDLVTAVFAHFPAGFKADKAKGWSATLHWLVAGGTDQTVVIQGGVVSTSPGLSGTATCTVKAPKDVLVSMFKGELDPQKAFMSGKATADNFTDLIQMSQCFDFKKVAESFKAAEAQGAAPAEAPKGPDPVDECFSFVPQAYLADKAKDWAATIHFKITGGPDKTILCGGGKARAEDGLVGSPTCTFKTDRETIIGILTQAVDPQKAFMKGKISADDLNVAMKFAMFFKFEKPASAEAPAAAPATPAAPAPAAAWSPPLGRTHNGGFALIDPAQAEAYAAATNDPSVTYYGPDAITPPMFHVRLLRDMMFAIITDPELDLDVLRLVHGEHDVTIHQPLRPWDVANLRARLDEVEQKSKGLVVRGSLLAYVNGVLAVEAKSSFFIRGQMKMPVSTQKTAEPAAPDLGPAPIQVPIQVSADQSYRYATVSLDDNPIHTDPDTAKAAGLPDVILHGLCTMALSGNAVLKALAFSDARKLKRLAVRFSKPVLNGATLTAHIHPEAGGCRFTVTDGNGDAVITNGIAELAG